MVRLALEGTSSWLVPMPRLHALVAIYLLRGGFDPISQWRPGSVWRPGLLRFSPDESRHSASKVVQDIWDVYLETLRLVLVEVRVELRNFCHVEPTVDKAWKAWCTAAERGLLSAYKAAGGPTPQGDLPLPGRRKAVIRTRLVGRRAHGRLKMIRLMESLSCLL